MAKTLRKDVYESIVYQPLEFFSTKAHSTGNLTGILAQEIRSINASTINMYFLLIQGFVGMITGLTISLIYSWKIGLVACIFLPTILLCLYYHRRTTLTKKTDSHNQQNGKKADGNCGSTEDSRAIISDSVLNHTTLSTLANEQVLVDRYFKNNRKGKLEQLCVTLKGFAFLSLSEIALTLFYYPMFILYANGIEEGGSLTFLRAAVD